MSTAKSHKKTSARKPHSHNSDPSSKNGFVYTITSALFGTLVGAISSLILSALFSFVSLLSSDPNAFIIPYSLSVLYISSITSGFVAVKRRGSSAIFCGGLSGVFLMLLFVVFSLFFDADTQPNFKFPISMMLRVSIIIAAIVGGYIGLKKGNKKSGAKRNRR